MIFLLEGGGVKYHYLCFCKEIYFKGIIMRKVVLSLALAGILGATSAVAEESGAFADLSAGSATHKFKDGDNSVN